MDLGHISFPSFFFLRCKDSHARVLVSMRPFLTTRAKSEVTANSPHSTPLKGLCDIQTWNQTSAIQLMWRNVTGAVTSTHKKEENLT